MQTTLQLDDSPPPSNHEGAALAAHLKKHPGWHLAATLAEAFDLPPGEASKRQIRKWASAHRSQIVSGPGTAGYQHISHCTAAEINRTLSRYTSQIRDMQQTVTDIMRGAREYLHGPKRPPDP